LFVLARPTPFSNLVGNNLNKAAHEWFYGLDAALVIPVQVPRGNKQADARFTERFNHFFACIESYTLPLIHGTSQLRATRMQIAIECVGKAHYFAERAARSGHMRRLEIAIGDVNGTK